jgi:hypothetical protein
MGHERPPAGDGSLGVENAEQYLGEQPLGEHRVNFRVINRSDQPGEVIGYPGRCGMSCCYFVREPLRRPIAPGEVIEVAGELGIRLTGPFVFEGPLYLNDGGQLRTVQLRITGVGVVPEKPHAPPP